MPKAQNKSNKKNTNKKEINTQKNIETTKESRKPNKLIVILIIILIIVIIFAIIVKTNNKKTETTKKENNIQNEDITINTKKNVVKDQKIDGLIFSDINLISQNDETYLTVEVTNNSDKDYHLEEVHIFLKDKEGNNMIEYIDEEDNVINYLIGYVGDTIKVGEKRTVVSNIDIDISDKTYTVEYEIVE